MYKKFEELCKQKGVTPYKVSKETGVSTATLTSWKQGKYIPKKEKLQKIADFFEVPISYFYSDDDKTPLLNLLSEAGGLDRGLQGFDSKYNVHIALIDEPEISLHSKPAYELIKKMKDMPDEDLDFLLKTAEKISPNPVKKQKTILVKNPHNVKHKTFDTIASAKEYLSTLPLAAFGGGKGLSDEAIIDMANTIYNDKNK